MNKEFVVFIEASSTGAGSACADAAQQLGYKTLLVSRNPDSYSVDITRYINKIFYCETNDFRALELGLKKLQSSPDVVIKAVLTTNDFYVRQTAWSCEYLGLPGLGNDAADACYNKQLLRERLRAKGLGQLNPNYLCEKLSALKDDEKRSEIAVSIKYPFVIKPVDANDSLGVRLIYNDAEFKDYIDWTSSLVEDVTNQQFLQVFLIEEYIELEEYSVEVIVDYKRQITVLGIFKKELSGNKPAPFIKIGAAFPYDGAKKNFIETIASRVIEAIESGAGILNIDCRVEGEDFKVLEINGRMVGDQMGSHIIPLSTDYSLAKTAVEIALGFEPSSVMPKTFKYCAIYRILPDRAGIFAGIDNLVSIKNKECVDSVNVFAPKGKKLSLALSNQDTIASIIVTGDSLDDALKKAREICSEVEISYINPIGEDGYYERQSDST
jgi:S-sulfo-L-cysteine synthase (3-phospho-L-serine-dependent)